MLAVHVDTWKTRRCKSSKTQGAGISVINTAWKEKLQGRWAVKRLAEAAAIISRPKQLTVNREPYMMGCAEVHPLSHQLQSGAEIRRTTGIVDELEFVAYESSVTLRADTKTVPTVTSSGLLYHTNVFPF